jgi:hypothetical protein
MMPAMAAPPKRKLRVDRLLFVVFLLGVAGFATYWFALR